MELLVKSEITIEAPASKVWDILTNPSQTKKYMFGCEAISDWKPGSPLVWKGDYEGREMIFVKGTIVYIEPRKSLVYTTIDPNSATVEDRDENYLTVTYDLAENDGKTVLGVTQGDFSNVADGEARYKEAYNNGKGWEPILVQIKKLAEE